MPGRLGFTMLDYNGEKSNMRLYTGEVTAVSLPGLLTEVGTLRTAIEGITIGTVESERLSVFDTNLSNTLPASVYAQRETKWLVVYEDITPFFDDPTNLIPNEGFGKTFTMEIGTADLTLLQTNSNKMIIASGAGQTFVTAFETTARSPYGGAVNVLEVRHVGRNT